MDQSHFAEFLQTNKEHIFKIWGAQPLIIPKQSDAAIILEQSYKLFNLALGKFKCDNIDCSEDLRAFSDHLLANHYNPKVNISDIMYNFSLLKTALYDYIDIHYDGNYHWKTPIDAVLLNFITIYITYYLERQTNSNQSQNVSELHKDRLTILGQMTSSFVHEFRNPLTSIKGFVQLLKAEQPELPYLDIILSELDQLNSRISQFLLVSRKERIQTSPTLFTISELIDEIIAFIYPSIVDNNISIEVNIETNFSIYGHRDEIRQVLLNIILNAVDVLTLRENPTIIIYGHQEANYNLLELINNGPEIKKDILDDIFKPFITTKESGTGLGLFVSKEIIEKHNGSITCSSTSENTTFTIIFPNEETSIS